MPYPKAQERGYGVFKHFLAGRAKYPRFKSRHHTPSVRYQLDQCHVAKSFSVESKRLILPKFGGPKLKWSRGGIEGTSKRVTLSQGTASRYFAGMACSECGTVQKTMPLKVREWTCGCGAVHDRDINAAKNVLLFGTVGSAGTSKVREAVKPLRAVA